MPHHAVQRSSVLDGIRATARPPAQSGREISAQPKYLTEITATCVHAERGLTKRIAAGLGVREWQVYEVADINDPKPLKAAWIPTIVRETGSFAILDALEAQVGRVAFLLPPTNPHADEMSRELARTIKQFGEFLETNSDVLADGRIAPHEVKPLLASLDAILADVSEYRAAVVRKAALDA